MEMEFLSGLVMPIVLVACLVIGFIFKKWIPADNKFIPTLLAVVGAILGCVSVQAITLEAIVGGAVSGLASTGLHQAFKQFIGDEENDKEVL